MEHNSTPIGPLLDDCLLRTVQLWIFQIRNKSVYVGEQVTVDCSLLISTNITKSSWSSILDLAIVWTVIRSQPFSFDDAVSHPIFIPSRFRNGSILLEFSKGRRWKFGPWVFSSFFLFPSWKVEIVLTWQSYSTMSNILAISSTIGFPDRVEFSTLKLPETNRLSQNFT